MAVNFGSIAATNIVVLSDTQITATSPAGAAGAVDVTVVTPVGTSSTSSADLFSYYAPPVTSVSSTQPTGAYDAGTVLPITVTFGEPVTVTGTPTLALNAGSGAVASYSGGSGTDTLTFSYTVAAGQSSADLDYTSTAALALAGGTIVDAAGSAVDLTLPAPGADGLAAQKIVIDTTTPAVTGVSCSVPLGTYGLATVVPFTVTFNEPVTVGGTPQLPLSAGKMALVANYTAGSGTSTLTFTYVVAANTVGDLYYASTDALTLNGGTIQNAAGTAANLALPLTGYHGVGNGKFVIDTTAPTVTAVATSSPTGTYTVGGKEILITLTFSAVTYVEGTPTLALNAGSGAVASYTSGSGLNTLTFSYTVAAGQSSADLDYTSNTALALNGGAIYGLAHNSSLETAMSLTLPTPGTDGLATANIVIDAIGPTVTGVSSSLPAAIYTVGDHDPHHRDIQRAGNSDEMRRS